MMKNNITVDWYGLTTYVNQSPQRISVHRIYTFEKKNKVVQVSGKYISDIIFQELLFPKKLFRN